MPRGDGLTDLKNVFPRDPGIKTKLIAKRTRIFWENLSKVEANWQNLLTFPMAKRFKEGK